MEPLSCAPAGGSRSSARRSGSCVRRVGRCPSTASSARAASLFDVVADPELDAEVTLQPVRRHDVDAAVMFADIMVPVVGMGIDVELVENVGPVDRVARADARRRRAPARPRSAGGGRVGARGGPARAGASCATTRPSSASAAGPSRSPATSIEGKPTREFTAGQDADVPRARDVARAAARSSPKRSRPTSPPRSKRAPT